MNKTVLITGGSNGLGLEMANLFYQKGYEVHICSHEISQLNHVKKQFDPTRFITHLCDVTKLSQIEFMFSEIKNLDILINNAGIWLEGDLQENNFDQISRVVDVNVKGAIYITKVFVDKLFESETPYIINISSTQGLGPRPNQVVYSSTKWAIRGFTDSLREKYKDTKLKVIGVYPGSMKTQLFQTAGFSKDTNDFMDPADVAKIIVSTVDEPENLTMDHIVIDDKSIAE